MAKFWIVIAMVYFIATLAKCDDTVPDDCSATGFFGRDCSLSCNCLDGCHGDVKCQQCSEGWAGPTCQIRTANIALNQPTTQGPSPSTNYPASAAVDGDVTGDVTWAHASDKQHDTIVWWDVDLGSAKNIVNLTIFYKKEESGRYYHRTLKRRRGHDIWLSNSSDPSPGQGQRCYHDNGQGDVNSKLFTSCTGFARYVRVTTQRNASLDNAIFSKWPNLEIVEVVAIAQTGCSNGTYGAECELQCGHCQAGSCSREAGHCEPCEAGWTGDTCNTELCQNCKNGVDWSNGCEAEWYGTNCSLPCAGGCMGDICDVDTGHCGNCTTGLTGDFCNETCPTNCDDTGCTRDGSCNGCLDKKYHGGLCTESCNATCVGCFQNNGTCISCKAGLFGTTCEKICSARCSYGECDMQGHCKMGCSDGRFYGSECDLECSSNITNCVECISPKGVPDCVNCTNAKYGKNCENDCPVNCEACSSSQKCTKCSEGYSGNLCDCTVPYCLQCDINGHCEKCEPGYFGETCENTCPDCKTCEPGNRKLMPACLSCHEGLFKNDTACILCPNTCTQCTSVTNCSECKPGFYGQACAKECSSNCEPDATGEYICDGRTGVCAGDCKAGFYSDYCTLPCIGECGSSSGRLGCNKQTGLCFTCSDGFFGEFCNETCGINCAVVSGRDKCDRDTGNCSICEQGFFGGMCDKECRTNCDGGCDQKTGKCEECRSKYYGDYCTEKCPDQCGPAPEKNKKIVCNRINAECLYCSPGFHGERCQNYCENNCALLDNVANCKKANGHCIGCLEGHYGEFCRSKCDHCKDLRCHQDSGHCKEGCKKGWSNVTCTERCSSKCQEEDCDWLSGICLTSCIDGYGGQFCKDVMPEEEGLNAFPIIIGVTVPVILILLAVMVFLIIRCHRKSSQASAGYRGRGMPLSHMNGHAENGERHALIQPNGSTVVNTLPLPKKNPKGSSLSDDDLLEQTDETMPLVACSNDPSDYYNLSWPVPVADFPAYVRDKRTKNPLWYKEDFNNLPKGLLKKCNVAMEIVNKGKCRYKQLYPYDDNRVKLEADGNAKSDFINASYVNGYKKPQAFIAAQGPTDVNVADFWRMIFQKDCGKVVMLTNLFEECKMKCVRYWPDFEEAQEYGNLLIVLTAENIFPDYTVRHLKATHSVTREEKDIVFFHFTAWPDRGVPDNPSCLLNFRDTVMEHYEVPDGPILVHCSAGIGRTGTFVALDFLLRRAAVESHIDVFRTVTDMRYQRTNFVQTDVQYDFLHNAIAEALQTKEMEVPASEFCKYYWSLLENNPETGNTKLQDQFQVLHEMSPVLDESFFVSGASEENLPKTRHPDVLPVDMYRAYLSTPVRGANEYINAVFLPTVLNKTGFLITQMPLPHTVTDFWRLVFDQHVTTIVMMNNTNDNDETIGEYWPSDDCTYGPFKVELLSCENFEDYSTLTIKLTYNSSSRQSSMTVKQYRFESWAENDPVPQTTFALTALVGAVAQSSNNHSENPTLVHCMNGAERSGLFCVLSAIFEKLQGDQKLNIPQIILQWRSRRPQIIPNLEQFDFCYRAVSEYLDSQQIYSNVI